MISPKATSTLSLDLCKESKLIHLSKHSQICKARFSWIPKVKFFRIKTFLRLMSLTLIGSLHKLKLNIQKVSTPLKQQLALSPDWLCLTTPISVYALMNAIQRHKKKLQFSIFSLKLRKDVLDSCPSTQSSSKLIQRTKRKLATTFLTPLLPRPIWPNNLFSINHSTCLDLSQDRTETAQYLSTLLIHR